jgi:hypothetical protein
MNPPDSEAPNVKHLILLTAAGLLSGPLAAGADPAQPAQPPTKHTAATPAQPAHAPPKPAAHHVGSQFHPVSVTGSANQLYAAQWGVDSLRVQYTSSGNLLRFTYRVVEPRLAAPLADKKFTPVLFSPVHHAELSIPVMEKVGPLRQAMGQKAGMEYWMAFSNRGQLVKPGERVNITIGSFHADGLIVE